jgi:dUTP pyrophosphatase
MYVVPGGRRPERKTDGAIGYDAFVRAIVSSHDMETETPYLRKTLFDFKNIPSAVDPILSHLVKVDGKWFYRLKPGERVLVGIGFISEMHFPMFYWVAPRSGLATKLGVTLSNAPGTIDPDYRGEAGVIVTNQGTKHFDIGLDMRIAQIIFQWALIPREVLVEHYHELSQTERASGGFGSTGL